MRLTQLKSQRTSLLVCIACFVTYVAICMNRTIYSSAMSEIISQGMLTKTNAGTINASFYLFYSATQFMGGYMADRFSPFKIIIVGLAGAIITSFVMAISKSFAVMLVAWTLNGISQFGSWPATLKILSTVPEKSHKRLFLYVISFGYCTGTILSYLCAALVLTGLGWRMLFHISAIILLASVSFFFFAYLQVKTELKQDEGIEIKNTLPQKEEKEKDNVRLMPVLVKSGLVILLMPALIRGMLDVGLKSWIPTMLMENYGVSSSFASMLTTILLIINLSGVFMVQSLYPRKIKNIVLLLTLAFLICLPMICLMIFMGKISVWFIIAFLTISTTMTYAGNQMFNVIIPTCFSKHQKTGTVAGILNAFACFGIFVANFLYGWLSEKFGWTVVIVFWISIAAIALIMSAMATPLWSKFTKKN